MSSMRATSSGEDGDGTDATNAMCSPTSSSQKPELTRGELAETTLIESINASLDARCDENAVFLAERLVAMRDTEANAYLLARCHYASGKPHRTREVLGRRMTMPATRYLFAKACYDLERLDEAERALREHGSGAGSGDGGDARVGGGVGSSSGSDTFVGGYGSRRRPGVNNDVDEANVACGGAPGEYLLGRICKDTGRKAAAVAHFTRALALDPLMWSAYEGLCALGADAEAKACMSASREETLLGMYPSAYAASSGVDVVERRASDEPFAPRTGGLPPLSPTRSRGGETYHDANVSTPAPNKDDNDNATTTTMRDAAAPPSTGASDRTREMWETSDLRTPAVGGGGGVGTIAEDASDSVGAFVTPSPTSVAAAPPPPQKANPMGRAPPTTGIRGASAAARQPSVARDSSVAGPSARGLFGGDRRKFMDEGKLRKVSGRLFNDDPATSTAVRRSSRIHAARTQHAATMTTPDVHNGDDDDAAAAAAVYLSQVPEGGEVSYDAASRRFGGGRSKSAAFHQGAWNWQPAYSARTAEGTADVFNALRPIAEGMRHLAMYRCEEAINAFKQLPPQQYNTGYVLCAVAKAHAEMVEYSEAAKVFEEARSVSPQRLEGMDVYSTVLWHLKEEVKLSHLAQQVQELDRLAPQTWCVLGNCFSLQKEHETALKFFQRAIQIDPKYTYAYTLSGHEYFANEDFEKSMHCYRAALRLDARHYNAWYGLGTVYYRQEKFIMSEYHFRYALNINSKSSVLYCYAGMAKHALNENDEAIALLTHAITLDPKNPLARYEMAAVLMNEENYEDALRELEKLQEIAPKEASVFFLMGRIYKKLGRHEKAMINYSIALDLRPSNADVNSIKNAIEKLDSDELSDEDNI